MELSIPSIVCEGCVETISKAIKEIDSEAQITPNLAAKTITLQTTASLDEIRTAITKTGHILA